MKIISKTTKQLPLLFSHWRVNKGKDLKTSSPSIILDKWNTIINGRMNPLNTHDDLLAAEAVQLILNESEDDLQTIRLMLIEDLIKKPNVMDKEQYVKVNQALLIRILDNLFAFSQTRPLNENILLLYNTLSQHLQSTLDFIEDFFSNSFDRKDEKAEQTFYLYKGKGVTGKEAFNLLDGRSVHKDLVTKEGQPYKAWMQLDFENKDKNNNFEVKQFHEKYGFDLKAAVEKFPITDLKEPDKEKALMQSLQKGNVQSVTIEKDGSSHKMFIEADPQFKKVNLYDSNMKLVAKESIEIYQSVGKTEAMLAVKEMVNDKKKELKQELKPEKEKVEKKNDKTLLPKKRESSKKGLGVS